MSLAWDLSQKRARKLHGVKLTLPPFVSFRSVRHVRTLRYSPQRNQDIVTMHWSNQALDVSEFCLKMWVSRSQLWCVSAFPPNSNQVISEITQKWVKQGLMWVPRVKSWELQITEVEPLLFPFMHPCTRECTPTKYAAARERKTSRSLWLPSFLPSWTLNGFRRVSLV